MNGQIFKYSGTGSAVTTGSSSQQVTVRDGTVDMTGSTGIPTGLDASVGYIVDFENMQIFNGPSGF